MMSSAILSDQKVLSRRKRPKETSSKAKTAQKPFADGEAKKELLILAIANSYNYHISAINKFDHLIA